MTNSINIHYHQQQFIFEILNIQYEHLKVTLAKDAQDWAQPNILLHYGFLFVLFLVFLWAFNNLLENTFSNSWYRWHNFQQKSLLVEAIYWECVFVCSFVCKYFTFFGILRFQESLQTVWHIMKSLRHTHNILLLGCLWIKVMFPIAINVCSFIDKKNKKPKRKGRRRRRSKIVKYTTNKQHLFF